MIRHTLFMRFSAKTASTERDLILQSLISLCDRVGEVTSLACGPDVETLTRPENFNHAFTIVFGNAAARTEFLALPDYLIVLERLSQTADAVRIA